MATEKSETKDSPPSKKRKRASVKKQPTAAKTPTTEPPSSILVLDNGGDTIKYGWSTDKTPRYLPNVTARLQQQWTVLVGDQLGQIQNPNQLLGKTRSTERGMIVNLGNQVQVWKRILDIMGIAIPLNTDTAQALGWNKTVRTNASNKIASQSCAVLLALVPYCPRTLLDQILTIWMEDFGFGHVGFCVSPVCAARLHPDYQTCCVVDLGWSATHIVPVFADKVVDQGRPIRRLPLGGRHLINMWKYYTTYRQWNLMDQEFILREVLHQTGYVSMQFAEDMRIAQQKPGGRRPYDREFVLPDYQNTFQGKVQLPPALQDELDAQQDEQDEESDDESVKEEDMVVENEADGDDKGGSSEEEEEEETPEQAKQRLLKQRQEEAKRRQEIEAVQQVLNVSVERFAVPEVLFRPADAGLSRDWASLPDAIQQAIEACPNVYHAALYQSIRLVGGLSRIENLKSRVEKELRSLMPCSYDLRIEVSETPMEDAWIGARDLATNSPFSKWGVSRQEWETSSKRGAWKRLLVSSGGSIV